MFGLQRQSKAIDDAEEGSRADGGRGGERERET